MNPTPHILVLFTCALLLPVAGCSDEEDSPDPEIKTRNRVADGVDGNACVEDDDCNSRICLGQSYGFPDGMCTSFDCAASGCDGDQSECATLWDGTPACLVPCEADQDCREDYTCQQVDSESPATCLPEGGAVDPAEEFQPSRELLGFDCDPADSALANSEYGPNYTFTFTLSEDATSFLVAPTVESGIVVPISLDTPAETVDFRDDYRHHNARLAELGSVEDLDGIGTYGQVALDFPILVPYAPQFGSYVDPGGDYELTVSADEEVPCLYVLEGRQGTAIDLNIYLVGAGGRNADDARDDADLEAVFGRVDEIFGLAGVQLGEVRFFDVPAHVRETFRVVRSQFDVYKLTAYGAPPDETLDAHLSVDLFLVDDMQFNGNNVLGISAGVPGAAGLHGNARNGMVFQTTDLGVDNDHVAHIMAHEVGHYIGLRHTTEVVKGTDTNVERQIDDWMGVIDPIEDTPVCDQIQQTAFHCPDASNLMFPAVPPANLGLEIELTADQTSVFEASPLVK
jgi:hypothetical protein